MNAGLLDELVYLESPTETNNSGEVTTAWADGSGESPAVPDFAMVITEKGNEAFESARRNSDQTIRVKIRYRDDVKTTWRCKWEDQYYYLQSVDRSERREGYLWFTAKNTGAE